MKIATTAIALALAVVLAPAAFAGDAAAKSLTPQQQRMKDCNAQATGKSGDERRAFMSTCLKGGQSTASAADTAPQPAKKKSKANAAAH